MPRKLSHIAPDWWDYTTLDFDLINDAARLTERDLRQLSRPGFKVVMYDTLEDFYLAEALEYITAWKQSTPDNPVGICGPIGPTEQLPLVARADGRRNLVGLTREEISRLARNSFTGSFLNPDEQAVHLAALDAYSAA